MTPSWYDVLDVDPTASADEVRAAWRAGVADLDPTDRRFRLLNQAAEVLLDPTRRAEHDAALAADATDVTQDADGAEDVGRRGWSRRRSAADGLPARPAGVAASAGRAASASERRRDHPSAASGSTGTSYTGWVPPAWLLLGLAVLVAVLVAASAIVSRTPTDASVDADTRAAQSAAEQAATAVLSYDYRDMEASSAAASAYLTPSFRRDYDALFAQLDANAESVQPVVTTEVVSSGIERVSATGDRVSVLLFVDRPTTNAASATPVVYQDFVTMRMQLVDGQWLVDDMITTPAAQ